MRAESFLFLRSKAVLANCLVFFVPVIVYGLTVSFPFLAHDDNLYITENPLLQKGRLFEVFTSRYQGNWIPLTWLSFFLEKQVFGSWAGGFHLVNVILHALASLLLLQVLLRWRVPRQWALFISLMFAVHPISVESVAWVTSQKDLFACVWALGAAAVLSPLVDRSLTRNELLAALLFFSCSLMSKQSWVGAPVLLVGIMQFRRIPARRWFPIVIPASMLSAGACLMTIWANDYAPIEARVTHVFPWDERIMYALAAGLASMGDLLVPAGLSAFHPYPDLSWAGMPTALWAGLGFCFVLFVACCIGRSRKRWIPWILLMLVWTLVFWLPSSGILPFSEAWRADRFFYISQIGVWGVTAAVMHRLFKRWPRALIGGMVLMCILCAGVSLKRLEAWSSSRSLFEDAYQKTGGSYYPSYKLGYLASQRGETEEAFRYFLHATEDEPGYARAWSALGASYAGQRRFDEALVCLEKATRLNPYLPDAWFNLGKLQQLLGLSEDASRSFRKACQLEPALKGRLGQ